MRVGDSPNLEGAVRLRCPTCKQRVGFWQPNGSMLIRFIGKQDVRVRRGARSAALDHAANRWEHQRVWVLAEGADGWTLHIDDGSPPASGISTETAERMMPTLGFECHGTFGFSATVAAGKRAARLGRASTTLPRSIA